MKIVKHKTGFQYMKQIILFCERKLWAILQIMEQSSKK